MNTTQLLTSALVAVLAAGSLLAQPVALPGTKSNITLTVTATSEYGGFLIRDSVIENQDDKSPVRYYYQLNPLGYEPALNNPANYYYHKETETSRTFGSGKDAVRLITESVWDEVVKLKTQRFSNVNFIEELIERELVPITDARGFRLVLVEAADRFHYDLPVLFFIESTGAIHYVGRSRSSNSMESMDPPSERDALMLNFTGFSAESYNARGRTVYKHVSSRDGVEEDEEGVTTLTGTLTGTEKVNVEIFPAKFYDWFNSGEGVAFRFTGHLNFNVRYDAKRDLFQTTSARVTNAPGSFESGSSESGSFEFDDYYDYISGVATLSLSVAGSQVVTDITPYLNALPEELWMLKQAFIDSYSDEEFFE
jgi:hypothetical protein